MREEKRDLRDPEKLGEKVLLTHRRDALPWEYATQLPCPSASPHDSIGQRTSQAYKDELAERAACGDRHAADMLKQLTTGESLPPDPGGN